jgi:hypothetical protein
MRFDSAFPFQYFYSPSNCSHRRKDFLFFQFMRPQHQGMGRATIGLVVWNDIIQVLGENRKAHLGNVIEGLRTVFLCVLEFFHFVDVPTRNKVVHFDRASRIGSSAKRRRRRRGGDDRWEGSTGVCAGSNRQQIHVVVFIYFPCSYNKRNF